MNEYIIGAADNRLPWRPPPEWEAPEGLLVTIIGLAAGRRRGRRLVACQVQSLVQVLGREASIEIRLRIQQTKLGL